MAALDTYEYNSMSLSLSLSSLVYYWAYVSSSLIILHFPASISQLCLDCRNAVQGKHGLYASAFNLNVSAIKNFCCLCVNASPMPQFCKYNISL